MNSKLTYEELEKKAEFFKTFADNLCDWEMFVDLNGEIKYISPSCKLISGYSANEFINNTSLLTEIVHPSDQEIADKHFNNKTQNIEKKISLSYRIITKSGDIKWIEHNCQRTYNKSEEFIGYSSSNRDITERKNEQNKLINIKDELAKSERLFRSIFDNSAVGISITEIDGTLRINKKFSDNLGYSLEELELKNWKDITHIDDIELSNNSIAKLLSGEENFNNFEKRYIHKNGSIVYTDIRIASQKDSNGIPLYLIATMIDISERKANEKLAQEQENRIQSIFRSAPVGIGAVNNRILTDVNDRLCEMTGYTASELINQSAKILYPTKDDYEYVGEEKYIQIELHGTGTVETYFKRKNGQIFNVLLSSTPFDLNDLNKGVTFTALDISEEFQAKQALKESDNRLKTLFQDVPNVAVNGYDKNGKTLYWNKASEVMYGYSSEEAVGANLMDLIIPDNLKKSVSESIKALFESDTPIEAAELILKRKDGTLINTFSSHSLVRVPGSEPEMYCLDIDISERKRAEEKLRDSEQQFKEFFDKAADAIFVADMDSGIIVDANNAASQLMQKSIEQIVGMHPSELHPKSELEISKKLFAEHKQELQIHNKILPMENVVVRADGTLIPVEILPSEIKIKGKKYIMGTCRDISLRKKAEIDIIKAKEKAEESEEKFKLLNRLTSEMLRIDDLDSIYKFITDNLHKRFVDTIALFVSVDEVNNQVQIKSISGLENHLLTKIIKATGFTPYGKKHNLTKLHYDIFKKGNFVGFEHGLTEYADSEYPARATRFIEKLLGLNKIYTIGINKEDSLLGAIHFFTFNNNIISDSSFIEAFAKQAGLVLQKKMVEQALKDSESRFKALHNASFGGITIHDNGIILDCNLGLSELTGYSVDELIGMNGLLLIEEQSRDEVMNNIRVGNENPYEVVCLRKNGEEFFGRLEARIIPYNGKMVRAVEFRDITEQNKAKLEIIKAKERAEESEAKFKKLSNLTFEGIVLHQNGVIIDVNHSLQKISGYSRDELIGKDITSVFIKDEYKILIAQNIVKNYAQPYEVIGIRKDGTEVPLEIEARLIESDDNSARVAAIRVISERKKFEKELQKQNKELTIAKENAEESDRLKSAFLANMSHEIRTPMNGILGFASLLKEPNLSGEKQQKFIGIIEKSGERMLNIINDIVSISKIEAGLMEVNIQESNINDQLEYIYTFFKPEIEAKDMQFLLINSLTSIDVIINTDREKVFAILTNLVKNAIKYTIEGTIELGYNLKKDSDFNNVVEFYVKDTGVGIPKNRQKAIFERFVQADIADTKAFQGAGLGLSISKAFVEMLGGKIWVESQEGIGSCFYFTLPYHKEINKETNTENETIMADEQTPIEQFKILIAEDDEVSNTLLSIYVEEYSSKIISVRNGADAVAICRNNPDIDLILMDVQMPEMGGYEAVAQIREFNKDIIIIAQTAYGLEGDREKSIDAGCNDYIAKPINEHALKQIIFKYLVAAK